MSFKSMSRFAVLAFIALLVFSCSQVEKPTQASEITGSVNVTIDVGEVGVLAKRAKAAAISLKELHYTLTAPDEVPIKRTIELEGQNKTTVNSTVDNLPSLKKWTLEAYTKDQNDKVIHSGKATFTVIPERTAEVKLNLTAAYSMLQVHFFPIYKTVTKLELMVDNTVKADTTFAAGSMAGDTVHLNFDYLTVSRNHALKVVAYGIYKEKHQELYSGDTSLYIRPGVSKNCYITMDWVGPDPVPPFGQAKMLVALGPVGQMNVYVEMEDPEWPGAYLVGGTFWSDSLLDSTRSPYILAGNLQIPKGVTLTLDPGVQIRLDGDHSISVEGAIVANGTSRDPIVFKGGDCQLKFSNTDLSKSQISHVRMKDANRAIEVAQKNKNTLVVRNSVISSSVRIRSYGDSSFVRMVSSTLTNAHLWGSYSRTGGFVMDSCTIADSRINAYVYHKNGFNITNSTISGTNFNFGCCGATMNIKRCNLTNCYLSGYSSSFVLRLAESKLKNTQVDASNASEVDIRKCSFEYDASFAFRYNTTNSFVKISAGVIDSSSIVGNGSNTGLEIDDNDKSSANCRISNTTISGNQLGIKVSAQEQEGGLKSLVVENCNIMDNEGYNLVNRRQIAVTATDNYWGTNSESTIAGKIFDHGDSEDYGKVTFKPFASTKR